MERRGCGLGRALGGCGSGEFCELAAARGAQVSGVDAAEGLIEIARPRLPEAGLSVGPIEQLPWPGDGSDLVAGFNAFQFAVDFVAALAEARRVVRPGGQVAICSWGRVEDREVHAIFEPLIELKSGDRATRPRSASQECLRTSFGRSGSAPSARVRSSFPTSSRPVRPSRAPCLRVAFPVLHEPFLSGRAARRCIRLFAIVPQGAAPSR